MNAKLISLALAGTIGLGGFTAVKETQSSNIHNQSSNINYINNEENKNIDDDSSEEFENNIDDEITEESNSQQITNNSNINVNQIENATNENADKSKYEKETSKNDLNIETTENITNENIEESDNQNNTFNEKTETLNISQEEALELLKNLNNEIEYEHVGDESKFSKLQEKELKGYVFLANMESDLGYFVNKETKEIYYFHPSGYLEKIINHKN